MLTLIQTKKKRRYISCLLLIICFLTFIRFFSDTFFFFS